MLWCLIKMVYLCFKHYSVIAAHLFQAVCLLLLLKSKSQSGSRLCHKQTYLWDICSQHIFHQNNNNSLDSACNPFALLLPPVHCALCACKQNTIQLGNANFKDREIPNYQSAACAGCWWGLITLQFIWRIPNTGEIGSCFTAHTDIQQIKREFKFFKLKFLQFYLLKFC